MPEPPYGIIWDQLKSGNVIPFLGAGCSHSGRLPPGAKWSAGGCSFPPDGKELAEFLAKKSNFPASENPHDREDLAKVSSYYLEQFDRPGLLADLRRVFDRNCEIGDVHRFLAELNTPVLIVTTNYDDLVERAFKEKERPFHLVVHPADNKELAGSVLWWKPGATEPEAHAPSKLPLSVTDTTVIYKMHGSVDRRTSRWDSFVVTEEDYIEFLSRMTGQSAVPARFLLHFLNRRFLFLGYGLADWNLRVVLKSIRSSTFRERSGGGNGGGDAEEGLRSWAIQWRPSELEVMLWEARKVKIYSKDIDEFIKKMREARDE